MATKDTIYTFLDPPTQPDDLGVLGHYRVISELGRGGMGFVFRAEDTRLRRSVALKVMNEKIAATPNSRERFMSEARAMAAVDNDNVITIYEVGDHDGTPFMAMEMLQGDTLEADKAKKERPGFEDVIDIAKQIARGLAAAHAKGIVHRDIKPANIWIEADTQRVKILDFGLALAETPVDQLAGRGSVIGTPGYLSPEQARSEPLDDRSDLYSLGAVLYELCTGRLPLTAKSVAGQLIGILAHDPKPLRDLNPDIPAPLADLIHQLLSKEPQDRPSSAVVLEKQLDRVSDECHAKSEVALALDKLQAGLQEVVGKKEEPMEVGAFAALGPPNGDDAFASLPDNFAVPSSSGDSSGAIPVISASANPYTKRAISGPDQQPSPSAWQSYWPYFAAAGAVLLSIPIIVFAYMALSSDSPSPPVVANADQSKVQIQAAIDTTQAINNKTSATAQVGSQPNKTRSAGPQGSGRPGASKKQGAAGKQGAGKKPGATGKQRGGRRQGAAGKPGASQNQGAAGKQGTGTKQGTGAKQEAGGKQGTVGKPDAGMKQDAAGQPEVGRNDAAAGSEIPVKSDPVVQQIASVQPGPVVVAPAKPSNIAATQAPRGPFTVRTSDGNGADATMAAGGGIPQGSSPTLAVARLGGKETHHAHLRFDLSKMPFPKTEIQNAGMLLHLRGRSRPLNATIKVYGARDLSQEDWPEAGEGGLTWEQSVSMRGLDQLPLLAEIMIPKESNPKDGTKNVVRVVAPALAKFIRESDSNLITFVISGCSDSPAPIQFLSKENVGGESMPEETAPVLVIQPLSKSG